MGVTFAESGQGRWDLTLRDVQELALECGYRKDVDDSLPLNRKADLASFFDQYGVKAFTPFKKLFKSRRLLPPSEGAFADDEDKDADLQSNHQRRDVAPMPLERFDELVGSFEQLKWKMIARPGGATMRPDDYYRLHGAKQQFEHGDCNTEKPMWGETGALDFHGREVWEKWNSMKGMSKDEAKKAFCQIYAEALANAETNFRKQ